jgi:hypothetical protein
MERNPNARLALIGFIALLLMISLACAQAGEILTPAEATARAQEAVRPTATPGAAAEGAEFKMGDTVEFIGQSHLIPMYPQPGAMTAFSFAGRGETATVLAYEEKDGEAYYEIKGGAGQGWVRAENLGAPAAAEEGGEEPAVEGPQPGDTVWLTSREYLIYLKGEPCATRMTAVQERNVEVTIVELGECEGQTWYRVDAPTGDGWVPAENITTEAP